LRKKVVVIGSGFAGLSAASFMAKAGWEVTVLEKLAGPGGRARQLKEAGFTFDMGPSWYWMPDVFERYFAQFGKDVSDYYQLSRLDPSYRVVWDDGFTDIPASLDQLKNLFESLEPGAAHQLTLFLREAEYKYRVGIQKLVHKPGRSIAEFLDWDVMKGVFRLDVFTSMKKHVHRYFKHPRIRMLLEFPVLFLGALPEDTPALYSLMNYADIVGGTWYPNGGMFKVVDAMHQLAMELGVQFRFEEAVTEIQVDASRAHRVTTSKGTFLADAVIGGADYHHIESSLLPASSRSYPDSYWNSRHMAPSCLIYYVGLNKKLQEVRHHTLFFDVSFDTHAKEIYSDPSWPSEPLFYVSVPSVTDTTVAPEGHENLFFLIPVAAGLSSDTHELRDRYFKQIIQRYESHIGQQVSNSIIFQKSFAYSDFVNDYNSFKGNAYGLANTLMQTAMLKPACRSRKVTNLFFTGQLTVPGPGVPPSLISGEVVAREVLKSF
jgi:phytoene desaturase